MAREIIGATTETEALEVAPDLLIYGEALARGTEEMAGEAYHDVLGGADSGPAPELANSQHCMSPPASGRRQGDVGGRGE